MPNTIQIADSHNKLLSNFQQHAHTSTDSRRVNYNDLSNKPSSFFTITLAGTSPATTGNYGVFFTAPIAGMVLGITEVHGTKGTDGSAVTLNVEKLTGTSASGTGKSLLSTALSLKATINTVQNGVLVTTNTSGVSDLFFNVGDRFGLVLSGTPTSVADLVIVVNYQ